MPCNEANNPLKMAVVILILLNIFIHGSMKKIISLSIVVGH